MALTPVLAHARDRARPWHLQGLESQAAASMRTTGTDDSLHVVTHASCRKQQAYGSRGARSGRTSPALMEDARSQQGHLIQSLVQGPVLVQAMPLNHVSSHLQNPCACTIVCVVRLLDTVQAGVAHWFWTDATRESE